MSQAELTRFHLKPGTYLLPLVVLVAVYLPTLYDLVIDWAADAAIIRISLPLSGFEDLETGTARALAFLELFQPTIDRALPFGE